MKVDNGEINKALKIKKAIQNYLEQTKEVNLRSTDIFPYLVRKGLYKQDKQNGLYFRRFLKKLYEANMLHSLIPQCKYIPGINGEIYGEWYFNSFKETSEYPKEHSPINRGTFELKTAQDIIMNLIEGKHPENSGKLNPNRDSALILVKEALDCIIKAEELILESVEERDEPAVQNDQILKITNRKKTSKSNFKSTSALAKIVGVPSKDLFKIFEEKNMIKRDDKVWALTSKGEEKGGQMKNSQYGEFVAWPEEILEELNIQK